MKKNHSGSGLIIVLVLFAFVLMFGGYLLTQKKSSSLTTVQPGQSTSSVLTEAAVTPVPTTVPISNDIDTNLDQLKTESAQVDAGLTDKPVDVMSE